MPAPSGPDRAPRPRLSDHVTAFAICPGPFANLVPAALVLVSQFLVPWPASWAAVMRIHRVPGPLWIPGAVLVAAGLAMFAATNRQFHTHRGTLRPNHGPRELCTGGLYAWTRNPMILSVFAYLAGAAMIFDSWVLAGYLVAFACVKNAYIALVEERHELPELHGTEAYQAYLRQTPFRWLPWPPRRTDPATAPASATPVPGT